MPRTFILAVVLTLSATEMVLAEKSQKPQVKSVTYSGNATYTDSRLEGLMLTRPSRFLARSRFYPEIFQDDLATLTSFYRQNGFLQTRIVDTVIAVDSIANTVDIAIVLDEGPRTFVEAVTLFGNRAFPDSLLMKEIRIGKGDPLRRPAIEDAVVSLLSLYAEHGFLDASATPKVQINDSTHLARVDFDLHEGVSSTVGRIDLAGAEKTRRHVILREMTFSPGDTIRYSELINSQRRLYLTGLFVSVFVRPGSVAVADSAARNILVEVEEKASSELAFSVGYGTVEKIRGRIELNTSNLAGTARKAGVGVEANFIRQGIAASFSEPWTLGTRWKTDLSLYGQFRQEPSYDAEVIGGKLTLGRTLGSYTSVAISYRMENTKLSRVDLSVPVDTLDPRIRSITLAIAHDSRDNLFDPIAGWYANWSNEIAGGFLRGSNTFARSVLSLKTFQPWGHNTVIGSAIEVGWMTAFGASEQVPVSERFYTGGPTSLRGFGYQRVGPLDENGNPLGGQLKLVWNLLELRRSLYRMMAGAIFVELGNVWPEPSKAQLSDLRADLGGGLRVNSPLGIVRLDCGINVDRHAGESGAKVFLSMGQAF